MKKILIAFAVITVLFVLPVSAKTAEDLYREQLEESGGKQLLEDLPPQTRELLDRLKIGSLEYPSSDAGNTASFVKELLSLFTKALSGPLKSCGTVLGIVLLHAWVNAMKESLADSKTSDIFGTVCSLAACGSITVPIASCITAAGKTLETLTVFMTAFVPIYAAILLTSGQMAAAVSFQSIVLYAVECLEWVSKDVIVPLMSISLAFALIGSMAPKMRLTAVGTTVSKAATWLLTTGMVLFSGLLSLRSLTGTAADTLGNRALRFSVANFVPVVGNTLGEAFDTIRGCVSLLRTTMGGFGMAVAAVTVLPTLAECIVWTACLSLCGMCARLFQLEAVSSLLDAAKTVTKCLIGTVCSGAVFTIITVAVVTLGGTA